MNSRNLFLHSHQCLSKATLRPRSCLPPSGSSFPPPCPELLALLQVTLFLRVILVTLLCEGLNKPPIAWVIYHSYTHICPRARPAPAHVYAHVHVRPRHTYMHMCTSGLGTRICTPAHPTPAHVYAHVHVRLLHTYMHACTSIYIFPLCSPQQNSAAGSVPRMLLVCRGSSGPSHPPHRGHSDFSACSRTLS